MASSGKILLAVDLGASNGRLVAGKLDGDRLQLEEVHRFENGGILAGGSLYWDFLGQWRHIQDAMQAAAARFAGAQITSIGVDTWGVDFGLLDRKGGLLANPIHYRDRRTEGVMANAFEKVSREEIFEATGIQFMQLNTLYQLLALHQSTPTILDSADSLLMMPDLFHWLMTGEKANEFTDATTTQFFDPRRKQWCTRMLDRFGIPTHMLGNIVQPGTVIGGLRSDVAEEVGLRDIHVVLPGTHDTASAVVAVPAAGQMGAKPNWCYISSGTWSLMGVETRQPVINQKCRELNFTNEGGVEDTIRLLKNIAGLWIVQECRRMWEGEGRTYDWQQLIALAEKSPPLVSLIDPDESHFVAPPDMPAAIRQFCHRTNQPIPESDGAIIRCALESLALRYRLVLQWLEELIGSRLDTVHIVGGGTQNKLLCQMAANACQRPVVAGPVEATAIGNLIMQAIATGQLNSVADGRRIVRGNFEVVEYEPKDPAPWQEAFARFKQFVG